MPHNFSVMALTFLVETPWTYISARVMVNALRCFERSACIAALISISISVGMKSRPSEGSTQRLLESSAPTLPPPNATKNGRI